MSEQASTEAGPQAGGPVGELARGAIERKKLVEPVVKAIGAGDARYHGVARSAGVLPSSRGSCRRSCGLDNGY
ncbi:MAG: hypothetical protein ACRDKL_03530 [Solirubrobacteraceae bacterium]